MKLLSKTYYFVFLCFSLCSLPGAAPSGSSARERLNFNDGWRFQKGDPANCEDLSYATLKPWLLPSGNDFVQRDAQVAPPRGDAPGTKTAFVKPDFDDRGWRTLTLPHDWGVESAFDRDLPAEAGRLPWFGVAWYRKSFHVPASDAGRQIYLEVDGAMSYASLWCNGRFLGGWPYGYTSFRIDLTSALKIGGSNTIAIRLDNPPNSSRWYPGGGIYRNVWLLKTSSVAVAQWGTRVTTTEVSRQLAHVNVQVELMNALAAPAQVEVETKLFRLVSDGHGAESRVQAAEASAVKSSIEAGTRASLSSTIKVANPALWSPAAPHRYVAVTRVKSGEALLDTYETPFGIRTIKFTANDGLLLNGEHLRIRGVCEHHDLGALGAAFNRRAAQRKLEMLKEMGVNAVRCSHNPPAPEWLDLCDEMGILVMNEFVDVWKIRKKPNDYNLLFEDWSEKDLRALVRRDRNHPSVILWSIGNEINEQNKPEGPVIGRRLSGYVHEEDETRPTTVGAHSAESGYSGFQTGVDVFGYNYKPHEYAKFRAANPGMPLVGSETASTYSSRGEYSFPVGTEKDRGKGGKIGRFQMSSYDLYYPPWGTSPEAEFVGQDSNPFVVGEFVWTGFDYLGEPTPYNGDTATLLNYHTSEERAAAEAELQSLGKIKVPSRSSYFGVIDLAGFKKDRFYLYQSRWRPELPMAHILPHWNWPERVGELTPVHIYTSGDEAELFLNGKSLGRKRKGQHEFRLRWDDVKYEPGELYVVAYKNGAKWADETVRTAGPAEKVTLSVDRAIVQDDGVDLVYITAVIVDANQTMVPRAMDRLLFEVNGPADLVATDNGDATCLEPFQSPERAAFNGLALAIVRTRRGQTGTVTVRASGDGLANGTVTFAVK